MTLSDLKVEEFKFKLKELILRGSTFSQAIAVLGLCALKSQC